MKAGFEVMKLIAVVIISLLCFASLGNAEGAGLRKVTKLPGALNLHEIQEAQSESQ
jgi:hypothetical protein